MITPEKTRNIKETLQKFASDSYTPVEECDFTLHGVITYFKTPRMETFAKYTDEYRARYSDHEQLIKDRVIFRQFYAIVPAKREPSRVELDYTLDLGANAVQPLLILKPTSRIPFQEFKPKELFALLVREVNKIKAEHGMLVGLLGDAMIEDMKNVVKLIYAAAFDEEFPIVLFNGIEPEVAVPSKLILNFEKKNSDSRIKEVEPGELIVTYIKPVYGHNGLNAYGQRINYDNVENEPFLSCAIDQETIESKEDEKAITLFSKKRGFVDFTPQRIEISNKLTLREVNRVQSQIASEEANEIEIVVTQDDITKDSVGEGVVLTSETIHISGHVADKARLEAKTLIIDGASHTGSILHAREATINRHKGVLHSHIAHIKLLEGGEVHGTHIHIDAALGGTVRAEHVTIRQVKQHLKIYATESITIERISGEDNLMMIDYRKVPVVLKRLKYIEDDINELRYHLEEAKRHNEKDVPRINDKIVEYKSQIEAIKASALHASITIKEPLRGYNTITFALPKNKEISYKTKAGQYEPFYIETTRDKATLHPVGVCVSIS